MSMSRAHAMFLLLSNSSKVRMGELKGPGDGMTVTFSVDEVERELYDALAVLLTGQGEPVNPDGSAIPTMAGAYDMRAGARREQPRLEVAARHADDAQRVNDGVAAGVDGQAEAGTTTTDPGPAAAADPT